jgi:hypothetical protein
MPVKHRVEGSNPSLGAIEVSVNGKPAASKPATASSILVTSAKPNSPNGWAPPL